MTSISYPQIPDPIRRKAFAAVRSIHQAQEAMGRYRAKARACRFTHPDRSTLLEKMAKWQEKRARNAYEVVERGWDGGDALGVPATPSRVPALRFAPVVPTSPTPANANNR